MRRLVDSAMLATILLVVCFAVGTPLASSAPPVAPFAEVGYAYHGVGAIDGDATGNATAYEVRPFAGVPDRMFLGDVHATLLVVRTEVNYTVVAGQFAVEEGLTPLQTVTRIGFDGSDMELSWPERSDDSLGIVYGPRWHERQVEAMTVPLDAAGTHWSTVAGHADREDYWFPWNGNPQYRYGGFSEWHRTLVIPDAAPIVMDGAFVAHVREAEIQVSDGRTLALGPHVRVERDVETPLGAASRARVIITDGFLVVESARLTVESSGFELAVAALDLTVGGDLTMHDATGTFRVGSGTGRFAHESIVLSGGFRFVELIPDSDDVNNPSAVLGRADGDIAVVAVDYIVQAVGPAGPTLIERALWATLALTTLSLLAWAVKHVWVLLYTRIKEDEVLEHPKRAEIMTFVEQNPGCHVLRVAGDLGMARSVARHHIMVLERAGRLRRYHESGQNLLVPAGQPKATALRALAEEDPHLASIRVLVDTGGVRRSDLVSMLRDRHGVADPTARRWIEKAVRCGLIEEAGKGHAVTYRAAS